MSQHSFKQCRSLRPRAAIRARDSPPHLASERRSGASPLAVGRCVCDHLTEFVIFEFPQSVEELLAVLQSSVSFNSVSARALQCALDPRRSWWTALIPACTLSLVSGCPPRPAVGSPVLNDPSPLPAARLLLRCLGLRVLPRRDRAAQHADASRGAAQGLRSASPAPNHSQLPPSPQPKCEQARTLASLLPHH